MSTENTFNTVSDCLEYLEANRGFVEIIFDDINGLWTLESFSTRDSALDHLLESWNVNKTLEEIKTLAEHDSPRGRGPVWVFEHSSPNAVEGRLYCNWVYYGKTSDYELLFPPKDYLGDKPKSLKELRDYLGQGNGIWLGWSDRASVWYQILSVEKAKERLKNLQETNDWCM